MQIGMFIFTAVLLGLSYYLHRGLKGNFLNHTPQKEPQLKNTSLVSETILLS